MVDEVQAHQRRGGECQQEGGFHLSRRNETRLGSTDRPDAVGSVGAFDIVIIVVGEVGSNLDEQCGKKGQGEDGHVEAGVIISHGKADQDRRNSCRQRLRAGSGNPDFQFGYSHGSYFLNLEKSGLRF